MLDAIEDFRDTYAARLATGVRGFLARHGRAMCRELHDALLRPRSTIYLFGNGGSHAISKCIEFALRDYAAAHGLTLRTKTGVDVHLINALGVGNNPGTRFASILRAEGADERDLLVLISGSGDSDNLCEAADYAASLSIPTIALIGSSRGKLCETLPPGRCFSAPSRDQQMAEDIIQSLASLLELRAPVDPYEDWEVQVASHAEALACAVRRIPADLIYEAAKAVVSAFWSGRFVLVSGFDAPALSVCAEHTAHNLYWDSVYKVESPPLRLIRSSPTACDFSGISNDRRGRYMPHLTGASEVGDASVAFLYSMSLDSPELLEVLRQLDARDVKAFVVAAGLRREHRYANIAPCTTGLTGPQAQASVAQVFGHILGRVIRMLLLPAATVGRDGPARFLIEHDLAQRRLLDG